MTAKGETTHSEPIAAVLDASAVLATLQSEPGADVVDAIAPRSIILSVNVCEVVTKLVLTGMPFADAREAVISLGIPSVPFDEELALLAASLVASTKKVGLSLGDRACLALAMSRGLPVFTTESRWERVALPVDVRLIRTRSAA